MKKIILTSFILTSILCYSQNREKGSVELAPVLGVSFANYYGGDTSSDNESITRATFGMKMDYYFNDQWSLNTGLMYEQFGSQGKNGGEDNLKYLTIPLNVKWHFGSTRNWHLNFGPSFSFNTKAETSYQGISADIKDQVNSFQLGLNVGIGYKIKVNDNFGVGISYNENLGLTDVPKSNEFSFKNSSRGFNVSAVFKL